MQDFNAWLILIATLTHLDLLYAKRLWNRVHCTFTFFRVVVLYKVLFFAHSYEISNILSNTNNTVLF